MNSPQVVLHQYPHSHYCIRIRWILNFKGIRFQTVDYTWNTVDQISMVASDWSYVPVLDWDSQIIPDSKRIASFLESKIPSPTLYPPGATEGTCNLLNSWVDGLVMRNAARYLADSYIDYVGREFLERYEKEMFIPSFGITVAQAVTRRAEWELALNENWQTLEDALNGKDFILGDRISYADFGIASRLRLMEIIADYRAPSEFARIRKWYAEVKRIGQEGS